MENPRPEKVAVVNEVREKMSSADAVLLTEYRGLKVSELAELRTAIRPAGGEYRVYKNTLVRFAAQELEYDLDDVLTGPTALAFVTTKEDGTPGDVAAVAKALQAFTKGNPLLVLKGGILGDAILDANGAKALASLPTAAEIYARLAGAINSGARGLAGAISGVPRSIAYVLQAAIDAGAFAGDAPSPSAPEGAAPEVADEVAVAPEVADEAADAAAPEATDEAAAPDVTDEVTPEPETDETPADDSAPAADGDES